MNLKEYPVISIITVVFNSQRTIELTIKSVLTQSYNLIEYIVVDGKSTDGTFNIIKKYGNKISKIISEPDNGTYDAMNKGIKLSTGDVIGFLNADDFYSNNNVISLVAEIFNNHNVDAVYGDLEYVNNRLQTIRYWGSKNYEKGLFSKGWHPPHPTFFVKKKIYERYGFFNLNYKIAADYELMLRFIERYKISVYYIPEVLVKMRIGGKSNKNLINILKANIECYKAWNENGLSVSPFIILRKPLSKLKQLYYKN